MTQFQRCALLIAVWLATTLFAHSAGAANRCDRSCLQGFITQYLDALEAKRPERLPVSKTVKFTENGVTVPLGEALWATISGLGDYRVDYVDTETQQVASHAAFIENGIPGLMALRLKIVRGKIAEIETVLNRGAPMAMKMPQVESAWHEAEPASQRLTRSQLAKGAENYLKAVSSSDGRFVKFNLQSCLRLENGNVMAYGPNDKSPIPLAPIADTNNWQAAVRSTMGMPCADQLSTGLYGFITSYDNARFPIIDVERQIVFGQWNFRRRGDKQGVTYNGKYYPFLDTMRYPNENLLGQAFKFRDGGILRVQGVFYNANVYRAGTGWE
jgi:hypothetical protein